MGTVTTYNEKSGQWVVKGKNNQVVGTASNLRDAGKISQSYNLQQNPVTAGKFAYISDEKGTRVVQYPSQSQMTSPELQGFSTKENIVSMSPEEAHKAGLISKNEASAASKEGMIYNVPEETLKHAKQARKVYPITSLPETHSSIGMANREITTQNINQEWATEVNKNIKAAPIVGASYMASSVTPMSGIDVGMTLGVAALTGKDLNVALDERYQSHVDWLGSQKPEDVSATFKFMDKPVFSVRTPFQATAAFNVGSGTAAFLATGGTFGTTAKVLSTTGMRVAYGASLGLQLGETIKSPTGENLAKTFVYSSPLLFGGIAKGLQSRLPGTKSMTIGLKIKPKSNYVTKSFSEGIDNVMPTESQLRLSKSATARLEKTDTFGLKKTVEKAPVKEIGSGRQKLMSLDVSRKGFEGLEQSNKSPFAGLDEIMGRAKKSGLDIEFELEYMRYPPKVNNLMLAPLLKVSSTKSSLSSLSLKNLNMTRTQQSQILKTSSMQQTSLKINTRTDTKQNVLQLQLPLQSSASLQKQQSLQKQKQISRQLTTQKLGFSTKYAHRMPSFYSLPRISSKLFRKSSLSLVSGSKYLPSYGGVFIGKKIKKAPKGRLTGLELRYQVSRRKLV